MMMNRINGGDKIIACDRSVQFERCYLYASLIPAEISHQIIFAHIHMCPMRGKSRLSRCLPIRYILSENRRFAQKSVTHRKTHHLLTVPDWLRRNPDPTVPSGIKPIAAQTLMSALGRVLRAGGEGPTVGLNFTLSLEKPSGRG